MNIILKILGYGVLVYFCLVTGLFLAQRDIMYMPSYLKPDVKGAGIIGLKEINVKTDDGVTLYGWYKPAVSTNKPTVMFFHGNAGNLAMSTLTAMPFIKQGYGFLAVEYRGYSGNTGKPDENGLYNDARAFWAWLVKQDVKPGQIILIGESLGAGVATQIAFENPKIHTLVLIAPFTSAADIAKRRYPFMPVEKMLKDRYENIRKIGKVESPIIFVHGTKDTVVPLSYGEALYNAAPDPKSMIIIDGAGHNDLYQHNAIEKIMSLLAE